MTSRGGRRATNADSQALHELGVAGRKTGIQLRDTGKRDEYGMQPLDDLLSSPEKSPAASSRGPSPDDNEYGSDDMDIETSAGPGPRTVLKERQGRLSIPRSRSPIKTSLGSPAKRNLRIDRGSSNTPDEPMSDFEPTVTRKLNFGKPQPRGRPKVNGVNGAHRDEREEEEEEEDDTQGTVVRHADLDEDNSDLLEESLQMVEAMGGDTPSPEPEALAAAQQEEEDEEDDDDDVPIARQAAAKSTNRGRSKPATKPSVVKKAAPEVQADSQVKVQKKRGRPAKAATKQKEPDPVKSPRKRPSTEISIAEHSMGSEDEDNVEEEPEPEPEPKRSRPGRPKASKPEAARPAPTKASAPAKPATAATAPKPRGRPGRKPKGQVSDVAGDVGETSFAALQRGPPMPKSRGLVSVRRDMDEVIKTRSGRQSHRPLDWWKGEQVAWEYEATDDVFARNRFAVPTNKGITCPPQQPSPQQKRAPRSRGRPKSKSARASSRPEPEYEDWEVNPGTVTGEVILWEPEHEYQPPADDEPVEVMEERVAVSAEAIQTRDIRDATFRFAKTLTTPFMGAGVVELPPGAEKRPKNSRKMHMVFFVHYGKALVTVNDTQFRITAGGMWFVPRGNYYSITNDYDTPCSIFFSQACEVSAQPVDPDQSTMAFAD
ncbi:kinetochore CENP-C fungal-like protein [Mariannaea sp. PMI_226]|nr:kinetochore CENP-C fungal-like protein [Mariannaea sp. PMI_226]